VVPLRGVFAAGDAWLVTGDLFTRDSDGDFWRVDNVGEVIRTSQGPVFSAPIRDALGDLPAVDLAVAYGVAPRRGQADVAVAAVTLREGHELSPHELGHALAGLEPGQRPALVHVVDRIPVTTWYRALTSPLRKAGIPEPTSGVQAWYLDASGDRYRPLSAAAHKRLTGKPARARQSARSA
jgi:putative long chain acyl-CoA synthase